MTVIQFSLHRQGVYSTIENSPQHGSAVGMLNANKFSGAKTVKQKKKKTINNQNLKLFLMNICISS